MEMHGQLQAPAVLQLGEKPRAHWIRLEGWVDPRASLDFWRRETSLAPAEIRTPYVPVPIHNVDYVGYGNSRVSCTRLHNPVQQPEDMMVVLAFIECVEYNFTAALFLWILLASKREKCLQSGLVSITEQFSDRTEHLS